MSSDSSQSSGDQEKLHAHIARLEAALAASEALRPAWNENWQKLLLMIAHWQISAEKAEHTSQDVNQPLSAIANYAVAASQLLSQVEDTPQAELQRVLGKLTDQVMRAGDILRTMRSEMKYRGPRRLVRDLRQIAAESLALFSRTLERAGVQLQYETPSSKTMVSIDAAQIHLVLKHLIQNAAEAMEATEVENRVLRVKLDQINQQEVEVSISNTGQMIEGDQAAKLFLPFYTTKSNRLGMGLAIARAIVETHNGKICLATNRVDGAEFRFSLPCATDEKTSHQ